MALHIHIHDERTDETEDEHIGWDAMVEKLMKEGHSKESAEKIAGYINKKKYGGGGKEE